MSLKIPQDVQDLISKITNKRALVVINHIIEHGQISTEDLELEYGYKHPPRAARDVREAGIPLRTIRVKSRDGSRTIGAYTFDDFTKTRADRISGRKAWPKSFKQDLVNRYGEKCHLSGAKLPSRALQIDHRIPYEIDGEFTSREDVEIEEFMLLSGTMNTAKAWSCRNCDNTKKNKDIEICKSCYWAFPEHYTHVAMHNIRRLDLVWQGREIEDYDGIVQLSEEEGVELPEFVKAALKRLLR
ncbi:MAG: HNH endonuclease [Cyanobacteria bacterium J06649_11]